MDLRDGTRASQPSSSNSIVRSCGGLRYLKPSCIRCCTTVFAASAAAPPPSVKKMRVVSGVQSTGAFHLGNYFGAIKNWVALQNTYDTLFFIVDLHAVTLPHDIQQLSKSTRSIASIYLAWGVDPSKVLSIQRIKQ
ncbi:hypothetical protein RIF29_23838 [Crotalaria pallida]|uniref:tryptophan--tRNA ligase n=1 Tax=Crotalaria pallida TaxID=3830 RepID=A0AAN9FEX4_CROPI